MEPNENEVQTPTEALETPTPIETARTRRNTATAVPATPKARKPAAPKPRELEVLDKLAPKQMTDAEKIVYIEACRDCITKLNNVNDALRKNNESAFEQFRNADASYQKLKSEADEKLALCTQLVETCYKSIKMVGGTH